MVETNYELAKTFFSYSVLRRKLRHCSPTSPETVSRSRLQQAREPIGRNDHAHLPRIYASSLLVHLTQLYGEQAPTCLEQIVAVASHYAPLIRRAQA